MSVWTVIKIGTALIALIIGIDIYFAVDHVVGNTWSEIGRSIGKISLLVPWCIAGLVGHIWHPIDHFKPLVAVPGNYALLAWISVLVGLVSFASAKMGYVIPAWTVLVPAYFTWWFLFPVGGV